MTFIFKCTLFRRSWSQAIPFSKTGGIGGSESWKNFSLRFLLLPAYFFILWIFYYHGFQVNKNTYFNMNMSKNMRNNDEDRLKCF